MIAFAIITLLINYLLETYPLKNFNLHIHTFHTTMEPTAKLRLTIAINSKGKMIICVSHTSNKNFVHLLTIHRVVIIQHYYKNYVIRNDNFHQDRKNLC